jgi:hypothetical protein
VLVRAQARVTDMPVRWNLAERLQDSDAVADSDASRVTVGVPVTVAMHAPRGSDREACIRKSGSGSASRTASALRGPFSFATSDVAAALRTGEAAASLSASCKQMSAQLEEPVVAVFDLEDKSLRAKKSQGEMPLTGSRGM